MQSALPEPTLGAAMFDPQIWAAVPFHFWSLVCFTFGAICGSFLNVCIHRLPLGESIVSPPSHCPHCRYSIPWYLNLPLITWLWLRGRCANCRHPISPRYFLVELLTGLLFLAVWVKFGPLSPWLALVYFVFIAGLIVATFIDFEHFIIPDEITYGGMAVGFIASMLVPWLHHTDSMIRAMERCFIGTGVGGILIYAILRLGKLMFGRQKFDLSPDSRVVFTETTLRLPDREIPYEEIFYRPSDTIVVPFKTARLILRDLSGPLPERLFDQTTLRLTPSELKIGGESFNPEEVESLEVITSEVLVPREAMGLGDVKFMAAIGAFLGWQGVLFSLMASAVIGSLVGLSLILLRKQEWSSRLPYGPYISLAALIWVFAGDHIVDWWLAIGQIPG